MTIEQPPHIARRLEEFRATLAWIEHLCNASPPGRLRDYEAVCDRLEGVGGERWNQRDVLCLIDIDDLITVWQHRRQLESLGNLPRRVQQACRGNMFYADDIDHAGRNFLFELLCASFLADIGMQLVESNGDIAATWLGQTWLGECKRPNGGTRAVAKRIKQASRQIEGHRSGSEIGIVFIDLTVAINPRLDHYPVASAVQAENIAIQTARDNAEALFERAVSCLRSTNDVFVACHSTLPFWIPSELSWAVHSRWVTLGNPKATADVKACYALFDAAATALIERRRQHE